MNAGAGAAFPTTPLGTIRESSSSWGSADAPQTLPAHTEADQEAESQADTHQGSQAGASSSSLATDAQRQPQAEGAFQLASDRQTVEAAAGQKSKAGPELQSPCESGPEDAESVSLASELEGQASSIAESVISETLVDAGADSQPASCTQESGGVANL